MKPILAALCAASLSAPAWSAPTCLPTQTLLQKAQKDGMTPQARGLTSGGQWMMLMAREDGVWLLLVIKPDGETCIVGVGEMFDNAREPEQPKGDPA